MSLDWNICFFLLSQCPASRRTVNAKGAPENKPCVTMSATSRTGQREKHATNIVLRDTEPGRYSRIQHRSLESPPRPHAAPVGTGGTRCAACPWKRDGSCQATVRCMASTSGSRIRTVCVSRGALEESHNGTGVRKTSNAFDNFRKSKFLIPSKFCIQTQYLSNIYSC